MTRLTSHGGMARHDRLFSPRDFPLSACPISLSLFRFVNYLRPIFSPCRYARTAGERADRLICPHQSYLQSLQSRKLRIIMTEHPICAWNFTLFTRRTMRWRLIKNYIFSDLLWVTSTKIGLDSSIVSRIFWYDFTAIRRIFSIDL